MHRISDRRVVTFPRQHLRWLRKLYGNGVVQNIVHVTSMWDQVTPEVGTGREEELRKDYLEQEARMARFDRTPASAWAAVNLLLGAT